MTHDRNRATTQVEATREITVPLSKVREVFRRLIVEGRYLKNEGGGWLFTEKNPFTGINPNATYASEDQAIDTLLGVYFPETNRMAA